MQRGRCTITTKFITKKRRGSDSQVIPIEEGGIKKGPMPHGREPLRTNENTIKITSKTSPKKKETAVESSSPPSAPVSSAKVCASAEQVLKERDANDD